MPTTNKTKSKCNDNCFLRGVSCTYGNASSRKHPTESNMNSNRQFTASVRDRIKEVAMAVYGLPYGESKVSTRTRDGRAVCEVNLCYRWPRAAAELVAAKVRESCPEGMRMYVLYKGGAV